MNIDARVYRFYAIPQPNDRIKVVGAQARHPGEPPIEPLHTMEFIARSSANRIVWREGRGGVLVIETDVYGATIIETRLQLR
jgi:hypothetical protein